MRLVSFFARITDYFQIFSRVSPWSLLIYAPEWLLRLGFTAISVLLYSVFQESTFANPFWPHIVCLPNLDCRDTGWLPFWLWNRIIPKLHQLEPCYDRCVFYPNQLRFAAELLSVDQTACWTVFDPQSPGSLWAFSSFRRLHLWSAASTQAYWSQPRS